MHAHPFPIATFAFFGCLLSAATAVHAATADTWVSGTGADTGACAIAAPCRTFAFAHNRTLNTGSINVLSSGNFGPLTITKSINIVAEGVQALINTAVSLRGLTIDVGGTNAGILFVSGAVLHVKNSVIRRAHNGILFSPASGTSELYVEDTTTENTSSGGSTVESGILVKPTGSGSAKVTLDRVRAKNGFHDLGFSGLSTSGSITATVRDSVAAGNSNFGVFTEDSGAGTTNVTIDRSALVNNDTGVFASSPTVRIGNSTVTGNNLAWFGNTNIISFGNNQANGNNSEGDAPIPTALR